MATQALLLWLVLYASLFAISGFGAVVLRGYLERDWSNRSILRACSAIAFVGAAVIWLLITVAGG